MIQNNRTKHTVTDALIFQSHYILRFLTQRPCFEYSAHNFPASGFRQRINKFNMFRFCNRSRWYPDPAEHTRISHRNHTRRNRGNAERLFRLCDERHEQYSVLLLDWPPWTAYPAERSRCLDRRLSAGTCGSPERFMPLCRESQ